MCIPILNVGTVAPVLPLVGFKFHLEPELRVIEITPPPTFYVVSLLFLVHSLVINKPRWYVTMTGIINGITPSKNLPT
jgi:hypothetical protein